MVVKTSDISSPTPPTAADIANYIQTAYENWNPPPTYVLLLGDSEFIPTHYKTPHPCDLHNYFETPTDLYYSPTPDIHIGRISVDKAAQAETIVNKILKYEKEPTTTKSFYTDVCLAAYFQDKYLKDGYEDRRFVLTSEEIRTYLQTGGYTVNQIYYTHPLVTPTHYNIYTYDSGLPLPWDLLKPGFFWNGNRDDITDKINEGILILNHRGHGLSSNWWNYSINFWGSDYNGWVDPQYTTVDIYTLTNGDMLPVVFSMNCMTGWFDNEIDQLNDPKLIRNDESFCEELLRKQNGGAVAAIGATRVSYSGHNDDLCKGFYDAIWTDFDPLVITEPMFELGQIHTYGKLYMNLQKWWGYEVTEFELFHLFGDPEMRIWTEQPKDLAVAHPMSIVSGEDQKIDVVVKDAISDNPVDHALVCLLKKDDNLQEVGYTDMSGNATFSVTPATAGTMAVTVTKPNCRPCESEIEVN